MTVGTRSEGATQTSGGSSSQSTRQMSSTLLNLHQSLSRFRAGMEMISIERRTLSTLATLKVLLFFDACYMIAGIVLLGMGIFNEYSGKESTMKIFGGIIGGLAVLSFTCNSLAVRGLRTWKRCLLVPWLVLWFIIICFLIIQLCYSIFYMPAKGSMPGFQQALWLIFCFCVFSVWCNMRKQFIIMSIPREQLESRLDVENMTRSLFAATQQSAAPTVDLSKDLPPKYEECTAAPPPAYDASMMAAAPATLTVATESQAAANPAASGRTDSAEDRAAPAVLPVTTQTN